MKGLTLEQMKFLAAKGLDAADMIALAEMAGGRSKGAERTARWRKNKAGNVTEGVTSDVTCDASHPPIEYIHTPQPVSNETVLATPAKAKVNKRGTRLPDDFEMPEDWIAWAMEKRRWTRSEATDEAECFARYWQAKAGREALKLDWAKTWQNWASNSRRAGANGQTAPPDSHLAYLTAQRRQREEFERRTGTNG